VTALLLAAALSGEIDAAGIHRALAAHKGRPVVLSLWATWCAPCVEEFPDLMAFARDHPGVSVLSVSIDDAQDRPALEAFVAERKPPFPVYAKAPGPDQAFIDGVDCEWSGVVPALVVFDRGGKRVALLQGERTREEIEMALAKAGP
jgi:thiol-disulfide isomerase/thioredoxin